MKSVIDEKTRIMVVDDDKEIREVISVLLSNENFEVIEAASGEDALELLTANVDLIILDVMMPGISGYRVSRMIRESSNVPILFLTARTQSSDLVLGYSSGGDDYLAKPYDLEVLAARIEARLRQERAKSRYISYGSLRLDIFAGCAYLGSANLQLTQKEFAVLLLLVRNAGRTVSKQEVLMEAWNTTAEDDSRALWTLISRLRRKLNSQESRIEISSKRGDGYTLEQI